MHLLAGANEIQFNWETFNYKYPIEVQRRRSISRKDRKHLENNREGKVMRGTDPASNGGRPRVKKDLLVMGGSIT